MKGPASIPAPRIRRLVERSRPRIGVLGAARIVPKALLVPAAGLLDVCAVAARDLARARAFADEHGITSAHGSYDELLARPDIDAVYVALPASLHATWTLRALDAGKHVLCEKPFGLAVEEAQACVERAQGHGLLLMEAHHWRYHPLIGAFQEALGEVGPITSAHAVFDAPIGAGNIRLDPRLGAGVLLDFGCYAVQWLAFASADDAPSIVEAHAIEGDPGVDVCFQAKLRAASGAELSLSCDMRPGVKFNAYVDAIGRNGRVVFENPLNGDDSRVVVLGAEQAARRIDAAGPSTYRRQLEAFLRALGDGSDPETSGASIIRTQDMLDRLFRAAGLPARAAFAHAAD